MLAITVQNPNNLDDPTDLINIRPARVAAKVYAAAREAMAEYLGAMPPRAFTTRYGGTTVFPDLGALPPKAQTDYHALRRIADLAYSCMTGPAREREAENGIGRIQAVRDRWVRFGYDLDALRDEAYRAKAEALAAEGIEIGPRINL